MPARAYVLAVLWMCLVCAAAVQGAETTRRTYLVSLLGAPLVEHARAREPGMEKPALRRALESADSIAYLLRLDAQRRDVLEAAANLLGRDLAPLHAYRHATNGMALKLTQSEAQRLATLPGVVRVRRERTEHILTDAGPQWIGADKLWTGQDSGIAATKGEGVVIGIVDTGINPTHPSFAATAGDGYTHTNPRGHFYGLCATGQATCNAKLIGIYDMTDEGTKGVDSVGHGSHVSGIAAGNAITDALQGHTVALERNVSGVAPHANLIMYKACVVDQTTGGGTCAESDLVAAIDQATADNVDVINYSIGGDAEDAYELLNDTSTDAYAFFQARSAGVVIAVAAGNEGPGAGSLDEPGNVPWVIGVANASHNRRFSNSLGAFTGAAQAPPTLAGQGYTSGYGPAPIVYAGDYGNALCGTGATEGTSPTGASNPFPSGTFNGQIVICDRGVYARVEKGYNVKAAGAGGYILANAEADGESIVSDDHYLPAVHLGYTEGSQLKAWLIFPGSHGGTISGVSAVLDPSYGDLLEVSSSRGPYGFSGGILKPDLTAPGTNILSTAQTGSGLALLTGTSMASPHVAGSAALVIAAHPAWSPAQVESALIGTAIPTILDQDANAATPLDAGAGRAQPAAAAKAGLYLPLSASDIRAQDPAHGGDPARLNRSGIENENCFVDCSFTRTVTDMSGGGTWQASVSATDGVKVTVTPAQFALASGGSQVLTINVDVSDPSLPGTWVNGRIILHKSTGGQSANDLALTLAAYASPGAKPAFQEIAAGTPGGTITLQVAGLAALPQATFSTTTLAPAAQTQLSLGVDPTPDDLYSKFPGTGKQFILFPVNAVPVDSGFGELPPFISRLLIVEVSASTASAVELTAGIDSNGNGQPDAAEQACASNSSAGAVRCVVDLRNMPVSAVNAWALIDVPSGNAGATYSITVSGAVPQVLSPPDSNINSLITTGPGHVPASTSFPIRAVWGAVVPDGRQGISPGKYYGAVLIDALPGLNGQVGFVPFSFALAAGGNDVTDALEPDSLRNFVMERGESLRHVFVDVPANGNLNLVSGYVDQAGTGSLAVYVARADFPAESAAADIAAAPAAGSAATSWILDSTATGKAVTVPVTAGRWYIAATNTGTDELTFFFSTQYNATASVAMPSPGAYYNRQRSGHGVFLSQAGGQQVVYWYTYLEDGTPIWYGAQADVPAPGAGVWTAPLFRVNWNGTATNAISVIGEVIVTPVDASGFMFSWHMNGTSGSEHFVQLAPSTCVDFNGSQANFTGQWYAPTQSGYGMDVLAVPASGSSDSQQFDVLYFYDGLGNPVWAAGSASPFAASTAFTMNQLKGFCPACAYAPTVPSPIGSFTVDYTSASAGSYSSDLKLLAPLSGSWIIDKPTTRLTGASACTQ
jgi:subtilisin family serine protease